MTLSQIPDFPSRNDETKLLQGKDENPCIVIFALRVQLKIRAGHVPTFLKSFRSVLERGASA